MRIGFLLVLLAACASLVVAQTQPTPATPSSDQMIEQLRSPRTRSLRNLQVESVQPVQNTATAATPSTAVGLTPVAANAASSSAPSSPQAALAVQAATATVPQTAGMVPASLSLLIQFDFDSARVKAESLQALANLAAALKSDDLKTARFAVEGHTDGKGRAEYNQRLSQIRAEAVSSYLASQGVARERLLAAGKGATELANRADPAAADNRRVRIINLD